MPPTLRISSTLPCRRRVPAQTPPHDTTETQLTSPFADDSFRSSAALVPVTKLSCSLTRADKSRCPEAEPRPGPADMPLRWYLSPPTHLAMSSPHPHYSRRHAPSPPGTDDPPADRADKSPRHTVGPAARQALLLPSRADRPRAARVTGLATRPPAPRRQTVPNLPRPDKLRLSKPTLFTATSQRQAHQHPPGRATSQRHPCHRLPTPTNRYCPTTRRQISPIPSHPTDLAETARTDSPLPPGWPSYRDETSHPLPMATDRN